MDTAGIICGVIAEYKDLDPSLVTPEATFEGLGIDSLDAIEIVYEIEDRLQTEIPNDQLDLAKLSSIGDVIRAIETFQQR